MSDYTAEQYREASQGYIGPSKKMRATSGVEKLVRKYFSTVKQLMAFREDSTQYKEARQRLIVLEELIDDAFEEENQ